MNIEKEYDGASALDIGQRQLVSLRNVNGSVGVVAEDGEEDGEVCGWSGVFEVGDKAGKKNVQDKEDKESEL